MTFLLFLALTVLALIISTPSIIALVLLYSFFQVLDRGIASLSLNRTEAEPDPLYIN